MLKVYHLNSVLFYGFFNLYTKGEILSATQEASFKAQHVYFGLIWSPKT